MRNVLTVMLPAERGEQLRALADHHGIGITDLIERWISTELITTGLPDTLPGLEILPVSDNDWPLLHFSANGLPIVHATPDEGRTVADELENVATNNGKVELNVGGDTLTIGRMGRGMVLSVRCGETDQTDKRSITPGIARDLARQFRTAADQAEALA